MLHTTLRSVSRPLRSHGCVSCILGSKRLLNDNSRYYTTAIHENDKANLSQTDSVVGSIDSIRLPTTDEGLINKRSFTPANKLPAENTTTTPEDHHDEPPTAGNNEQSGVDIKERGQSPSSKKQSKAERAAHRLQIRMRKKLKSKIYQKPPTISSSPPTAKAKRKESVNNGENKLPMGAPAKTDETPNQTKPPHLMPPEVICTQAGTLNANDMEFKALDVDTPTVPNLAFGLDRVLFNPGVYHLRDPRSRVYNFDPYLGNIMPVTEFDFNALKEYKTSSKDETLIQLGREQKKKYVGSSSSMTGVLSHFHYLLSQWRPIDRSTVSQGFREILQNFTRLSRGPAAVFLRHNDGMYAIDADKEFDSANILMNLGKSMEKLLTLPKEEFERYRRTHANKITPEEENAIPESFHYSTQDDFLMRSQLDAHDPRLPGTGMFDLKTRAVVSIRMNVQDYQGGLGYEIHKRFGNFESYEREYYDMIRAAFLKYSLQVRMGRMDGIFVAFHNTERIFGFQYIPISEMDFALHGTSDPALGDQEFQLSLKLWNKVLDKATAKYPGQSLRIHFDTQETRRETAKMSIFVQPVTDEQIIAIQEKNKAEIDEFQQQLLYPETVNQKDAVEAEEEFRAAASAETKTSDSDSDSSVDMELTQVEARSRGIFNDSSDTATTSITNSVSEKERVREEEEKEKQKQRDAIPNELFVMQLSIQNVVNNKPVPRPNKTFNTSRKWEVKYKLVELSNENRHPVVQLYQIMCKRRRKALLLNKEEKKSLYGKNLSKMAREGRRFREQQNKLDEEHGIVVYKEKKAGSAE